ncbi:MAG: PIN domain-containing protein [Anaerolineae bacterium]
MTSPTFIDTGYILALVNTADQYHAQARLAAGQVRPPFITTEAVLTEVGNALSRLRWRQLGVTTLTALRQDANIEVVSVDSQLFEQAIALYSDRPDKEWGLTDCISFVVMTSRGLSQTLTTDHHFEQAGFHNALAPS